MPTGHSLTANSFNLGIEMLFISRIARFHASSTRSAPFQSRNRDAFHFKCYHSIAVGEVVFFVSISESRCFSFQDVDVGINIRAIDSFQSRNRDAFHFKIQQVGLHLRRLPSFNLGIEMLFISRKSEVASFIVAKRGSSFNLGIEMLFVSSLSEPHFVSDKDMLFQSRNRDAFRFKLDHTRDVGISMVVSISESRCFSFQETYVINDEGDIVIVSISESRCFSFQGSRFRVIVW